MKKDTPNQQERTIKEEVQLQKNKEKQDKQKDYEESEGTIRSNKSGI